MVTVIQFSALIILALLAIYLFQVLFSGFRTTQLATGIAEAQRSLLQTQVAEIMG